MVKGLPPDSALGRAQADHKWLGTEQLLGIIADAVRHDTAQMAKLKGVKNVQRPKSVLTPKQEDEPAAATGDDWYDDEPDDELTDTAPRTARQAHQALRDRLAAARRR